MNAESRKIQIIENVLKVDDEAVLSQLETVIDKAGKNSRKGRSIYDFVGVISTKEAEEMSKAIIETSETIHPDDWK